MVFLVLFELMLLVLFLVALDPTTAATNDSFLIPVRFGQSVPLTGSDALDGMLYRDGILAAFQEFNDDPRQNKRFRLELQVQDDVGDPPTAKANVQRFVSDPSILGIIGLLGTTSTELASPVAFAAGVPVIAPYGGVALRQPFQKLMVNLRASYYDEAAALVEFLHHNLDRVQIALFVQNGLLGYVTRDGVLAALDSNNIHLHSYTLYSKKGNDSLWQDESIAALDQMQSTFAPDSIIIAADYRPASIFIPLARQRFPNAVLACLSRVSVMVLIDVVAAKSGNASVLQGVFVSQVVPLPTATTLRVVRQYQAALSKLGKTQWTFSGLEGYAMGTLAIQTIERIKGLAFTPRNLLAALYETSYMNLNGLRVGPFTAVDDEEDAGRTMENCNQGMRQVIVTSIQPDATLAQAETVSFDTCGYQTKHWETLTFGQSCSFTGAGASLCVAFRDGVLAAFKEVNDAGGIRGTTRLKLITKEDYGNETLATANNLAMLDDPHIFGLIGTNSPGIAQVVQAIAQRPQALVFGAFDGDVRLRRPFQRNIINFRASVQDEIYAVIHHCYYHLGLSLVSVLFEASSFGQSRRDQVQEALQEKRLAIVSQATYTSNNLTQAVAQLFVGRGSKLQAVVFIGLDDVFGQVAVSVHGRDASVVLLGLSKTSTTQLLLPVNHEKVNWEKLFLAECVPNAANQSMQVVAHYWQALKQLDSTSMPSPAGLEGYVVGQLLATSLNSVLGEDLTVDNLLETIYDHGVFKLADLRCGPLSEVGGSSCNQCMRQVFLVGFHSLSNGTSLTPFGFDSCMYTATANYDFDLHGSRLIYISVAAIGTVYTVIIMVLLVRFRQSARVRAMSMPFSVVSCVGAVLCFGGVFLLYPIQTDTTCALQPWLTDLAFVTLFGPIFAKTYRIDKLLNGKKLRRQVISDFQVLRVFVAVLLVFVLFLIVFTIADRPRMIESFTLDHNLRYETCASTNAVFDRIDNVLKALVLIWGCFLCQRVSKITGKFARFNESKELVLCIYHTTFLAMCLMLIMRTTSEEPNLQYACVSALIMENTLLVVSVLYGRPVYWVICKYEILYLSDGSTASSTSHNSTHSRRPSLKFKAFMSPAKNYAAGKVVASTSAPPPLGGPNKTQFIQDDQAIEQDYEASTNDVGDTSENGHAASIDGKQPGIEVDLSNPSGASSGSPMPPSS